MTIQVASPAPVRAAAPSVPPYTLIVLSHLEWDWVWQRPQHLLSRLARRHPVFFVMEPLLDENPAAPYLKVESRDAGVTVAAPVFSLPQADAAGGFYPLIGQLVDAWIAQERVQNPVFWVYTPMAQPVVANRPGTVVVFDAMDELAAFRFAPPVLKAREAALMQRADLVFTGGHSLYEARQGRNPHVYCFPSGVERAHFATALERGKPEAPALAGMPRPRIGFYGVIDERMDLDLLRQVAALRPHYQWIMVGPTAKIDAADLPQAPNIHYPGKQEYAALPGFLKGFDVCMMPFALNESTRFISPTKTLEYMAAHKPVISTPIRDVAGPYGHIVRLAGTADEFVAAVDAALAEDRATRAARIAAEDAVLAQQEWDQIAAEMEQLIDACYMTVCGVSTGRRGRAAVGERAARR